MTVKFLCEVLFLCFTIIITISTTIVHIITNSSRRPIPTPIDNSIEDPIYIYIYISVDCVIYSLVTVSSCYPHTDSTFQMNMSRYMTEYGTFKCFMQYRTIYDIKGEIIFDILYLL